MWPDTAGKPRQVATQSSVGVISRQRTNFSTRFENLVSQRWLLVKQPSYVVQTFTREQDRRHLRVTNCQLTLNLVWRTLCRFSATEGSLFLILTFEVSKLKLCFIDTTLDQGCQCVGLEGCATALVGALIFILAHFQPQGALAYNIDQNQSL